MNLPRLFREIHGDSIFNLWVGNNQPPFVRIVPREPLNCVSLNPPGSVVCDDTVTIVTVRCWNDRGTMQFEAASEADLKVVQEWVERHKATLPEMFAWLPSMESEQ